MGGGSKVSAGDRGSSRPEDLSTQEQNVGVTAGQLAASIQAALSFEGAVARQNDNESDIDAPGEQFDRKSVEAMRLVGLCVIQQSL